MNLVLRSLGGKSGKYFLRQLYKKASSSHFRGIFHTNNISYATAPHRCQSESCTGYKAHVDKWREGVAPEILELASALKVK